MDGGSVMASIWEELGIDVKEIEKVNIQKKKEFKDFERTIKSGSGTKPESLKLYNKHMNFLSGDSITAREYQFKPDIYNAEIDPLLYGIHCIQKYCKTVFGIDIDKKDAARLEYREFQRYYGEGSRQLDIVKELYPIVIKAINMAHIFTDTKLDNTVTVLKAFGQEIPYELTITKNIQRKYSKNQHKKVLIVILNELIPQINNKIILDQIAANNLL